MTERDGGAGELDWYRRAWLDGEWCLLQEYFVFRRSDMPPHVYATSSSAYAGISDAASANQSILVSGESGAGKTETVSRPPL